MDMPRTHGYSPRGERCMGVHDGHKQERMNALGAILNGLLFTGTLMTGTVNTDVFYAWLTQDLLPKIPPQAVIVRDNASFHRRQDIQSSRRYIRIFTPIQPRLKPH